jgi:hypothetical protein
MSNAVVAKISQTAGENVVNIGAKIPAGDQIIGKVGIDPAANGITLTGRKLKVVSLMQDYATAVNAGQYSAIQITPSTGCIGRLRVLGYFSPAIVATTGTQALVITMKQYSGYAAQQIYALTGAANGGGISIGNGNTGTRAFFDGIVFDANNPLYLHYTNGTDVNQTGTRKLFLIYEEEGAV